MKIGLIGAGYWGKNLVRVLYQLGMLKTICDLDKGILEERKKEYPGILSTTDFSEVLKDKDIKAIVISTPPATHYDLCKKALESEMDVFVEKPLALKLEEGKELVGLAEDKRLILMVGHLLLYHPAIVKLKEMIGKGKLGEIRYICSNRLNLGKLRREENVLWSFAPHDISIIIDILGLPKKVTAVGKSYLQKNIPDITLSTLGFEKDQAAHIFVSWLNPFKEQKLSVIGSKRMAVFDGIKNELIIYSHRIKNHKDRNPEVIKAEGRLVKIPPKEPLMEEMKHFLRCIETRKTPKTDSREALEVLKILDTCQRSLENNNIQEV